MKGVRIIGGGLAGSEAAWQLAQRGIPVVLYEMKPKTFSPAHKSPALGELVCSNSLRSDALTNGVGLLKAELRRLGSLVIAAADATRVPAGGALAVDREAFSAWITQRIETHPRIEVIREEVVEIPEEGPTLIATGPLTSPALSEAIRARTGQDACYFYDAIAPIVEGETIDFSVAFWASRYGKGGDDYVNCPMDRETYVAFVEAVRAGEKVPAHTFEEEKFFHGCMPIEVMAERGLETLAHGPMKPVGLIDPRTGRRPYAVVQLRQDDVAATLFNIVGFQTKLKWGEQKRIFRMIPGLERAEFCRFGSLHRNTFINAPRLLDPWLQLRSDPGIFFAGQITGVEGYPESTAIGLLAGRFLADLLGGVSPTPPPRTTMIGALYHYILHAAPEHFQPMNANFGLLPPLSERVGRRERKAHYARRALADLALWAGLPEGAVAS